MFQEIFQNHREKIGCDSIGFLCVSVSPQPLDCDHLQIAPSKGRVPLTAACVGACLEPSRLLETTKVRHHARCLFAISYPCPQRIKRCHKRIAADALLDKVVVVVKTITLIPHQAIDASTPLLGAPEPHPRFSRATERLHYFCRFS